MSQRCSSTEPFGGNERLSLENVLFANSFFWANQIQFLRDWAF